MPSQSVLKSKDYRQIIGFLTKVIDQTILHEQELNERFGDDAPASDAVILRGLRRKRDAAYRVLERMLELILVELGELEIEEIEPELASAIVQFGPIPVGIDATGSRFITYKNGVIEPDECNKEPNHAITVVGFTVEIERLLMF